MPYHETTSRIIELLKAEDLRAVYSERTTSANPASCIRNSQFILDHLTHLFNDRKSVFEIGSGTGHHACIFSAELPHLKWQTSDADPFYIEKITYTIRSLQDSMEVIDRKSTLSLTNILAPVMFNVSEDTPPQGYDAFYTSNTLHCMSSTDASALFEKVGQALPNKGIMVIYGPLNIQTDNYATEYTDEEGSYIFNNGEGNKHFDLQLKAEKVEYGIKNLDQLDRYAHRAGMKRYGCFPHKERNNWLLAYEKQEEILAAPTII